MKHQKYLNPKRKLYYHLNKNANANANAYTYHHQVLPVLWMKQITYRLLEKPSILSFVTLQIKHFPAGYRAARYLFSLFSSLFTNRKH